MKSEISGILRQSLPVLLFCALFEIGAGSMLGGMEDNLIPGLLVMVPPLLALRGNISGALASRLGTALHQGAIDPDYLWSPEVKENVSSSVFLTFVVSLSAGILAFFVTVATGMHSFSINLFLDLVSIALIAGMLSSVGLIALTVLVALFSYRRGWDPDNITSPLTASIGDMITVASIYVALFLVV